MDLVEWCYAVLKMVTCVGFGMMITSLCRAVLMEPRRLRWSLRKQRINEPPPTFLLGNLLQIKKAIDAVKAETKTSTVTNHNCSAFIFPFLHQWTKQYGELFMFSMGVQTILHVSGPRLVKEMSNSMPGKPSWLMQVFSPLLGQGIVAANGSVWAYERKLLAPPLYFSEVKGMMDLITDSAMGLVSSWMGEIKDETEGVDINIDRYLKTFSGDVVSKACFGRNYSRVEEITLKLGRLEEVSSDVEVAIAIPGLRFIPTKKNREAWALEKEINTLILRLVNERRKAGYETKDLLQILIESAKNNSQVEANKFIVDNCKNVYLAAFETVALAASWCLMLLASNPEWQTRVRAEVLKVCKGRIPNTDMLIQMKELTMVILESLRLYAPVPLIKREALNDMKIGEIYVAKGVQIWCHVGTLHTDPQNWGSDSFEFKPQRFANGVTGACKFPQLYMPFGLGQRTCIGQHLGLTELKVIISLILANFSFSLSPNYVHSPIFKQLVFPEYGVRLVLKKL